MGADKFLHFFKVSFKNEFFKTFHLISFHAWNNKNYVLLNKIHKI